jgi:Tetratricopeptide repeat
VAADRGGTAIGAVELQRRPEVASLPVRLVPRPVFLAGREGLLGELDARLAGGPGRPGPRVAVLCGLGGAGKTSVAVEYAHRHLAEVGVCWQFSAEDREVLAAEFGVLAAQLGAREVMDPRDPVASVHGVLARAQAGWLMVFDNVPDRAAVERFVPPAGPGRVLITTQNQHWPPGQALDVPVLDPEVAAGFLVNRTGDPNRAAAGELAAELDGLPLALEQAAAYMQATGTSLTRYLPLFRDRQADLLARGEASAHPADVAATLGLALSQLARDAPAAAGLVRVLAFLAPEPVPLALLLADRKAADLLGPDPAAAVGPLLGDPLAVGDAITALRRYSLASPAGDGLVLVHRLVQAITRAQLSAESAGQWEQAAAALVEAAVPADPTLPAAWPACAALLPHARAVLGLTSGSIWRIADYLGESGSYPAARDLFQLIADTYREDGAYGPEHPATLSARTHLAHWTGEAGDAARARDQFAALLPIEERVLGPEHPETLMTRHNLARWTGEAGDAARARDQFAALLPIREQVLGPEDPYTLTTRSMLARWTGQGGDAAGARDQYAALLPVREQVMGAEHPEALMTRNNLALYTGEAGDAAGARDQFAALLPDMERVVGPEHPYTLAACASLATWTGEAGDAAGARDELAVLLPVRERVLGPEHPDTIDTRNQLARWTGEAGDAAGARDQCAALLPIRERVLGPEHPETLTARHNLARWTGEAGDAAGARDQFAALLPIRERVLGPEHPDTLTARNQLARWTGEAGDAAGARDQCAALLPIRERVQGPEHPDTLTTRNQLARRTGEAGDAAGARDQFAALLPVRERVQGPEHPDTLAARNQLARWTGEAGDAAGARDQFAALLPVRERVQGPEHPDTLTTRANLAYWSGKTQEAAPDAS